jgi:hypothetical protein
VITRVRIEASAKTAEELLDDLIGAGGLVRETFGGEWHVEMGPAQTTRDGLWNYLVMVKVP